MGNITFDHICKSFGPNEVLKNINVKIEDGSFTILLGPSGCGKSTLLRILAGLEEETSGRIYIADRDITENEPKDRDISMVFQNYALYPHMTVYKNIEYGLKIKKMPQNERKKVITDVLNMVELTDHAKKLPGQLSGGQRQRVALARAIVKRPQAFLMDEPLSNLDAKLRNQMRQELIELHQKLQTTFLYVTHDQVEAMSMGSFIIIMNQGKIMQKGTPKEIYTDPANLFVAQFIGSPPVNVLEFDEYYLGIRPEKVEITTSTSVSRGINIRGEVLTTEQLGGESIYKVQTEYGKINVKTESNWEDIDKQVNIQFSFEDLLLFDKYGERMKIDEEMLNKVNQVFNKRLLQSV
ncbi:ABC transporter ATP-binding protein [Pueribacillus theae]|uniref:ABC transporter ATP-binding protein n=1 Tax=Pueribacillus theae TaxID=2171751 RepID=A0A2U1JZY8_9BACI|nr:ABC transporter ATP-binding protein [Pueribacillus theae]PWA10338.1 ABC transporter ATP-binding protein [Pueribacillus theae]